jgi:hypothetical protein
VAHHPFNSEESIIDGENDQRHGQEKHGHGGSKPPIEELIDLGLNKHRSSRPNPSEKGRGDEKAEGNDEHQKASTTPDRLKGINT